MAYVKRFGAALLLLVLVAVSSFTASASAHVLESDNGVSAILHIKPDDHPVASKPVPVNFLFSNDVGGFSLNHYDVQLSLIQDGAVKFSTAVKPLFFGSATEAETTATFPTAGVYTLRATGKPSESNVPAFTLDYDVRVADAAGSTTKGDGGTTALLSGFSLILIIMAAVKTIQKGGKYQLPTKADPKV